MANPNTLEYFNCQDIQIPDVSIRNNFKSLMAEGQYSQALDLLQQNLPQLEGKAYLAELLNRLSINIGVLQDNYFVEVEEYLAGLLSNYNDLINNFITKGTWSSQVEYTIYNFVVYNNSIYMCIQNPPVGTVPTNATYWLSLGLQGEEGVSGVNVNLRYNWSSALNYQINDVVVYDGKFYCATAPNINSVPTDLTSWVLFLNVGEGKINVGVNPPDEPSSDMIWFQTDSDPSQATAPVLGQFKKYDEATNTWDNLYPNVLFRWIEGFENYAQEIFSDFVTIEVGDWQDTQWVYNSPVITNNSVIEIWGDNLTQSQYYLYNRLSVDVTEGQLTITSSITPYIDLPIVIVIQ